MAVVLASAMAIDNFFSSRSKQENGEEEGDDGEEEGLEEGEKGLEGSCVHLIGLLYIV